MGKTNEDRAYDEGYQQGKKETIADDIMGGLTKPLENLIPQPDNPSSEQKSYEAGRIKGSKDRNDPKNAHYQGGNYDFKNPRTEKYSMSAEPYREYASKYRPGYGGSLVWQMELVKLGVIIALIVGAIWLAVKVVIPLIFINIAVIALVCSFIKKDWRYGLYITSFLGLIFIILDFDNRWLTQSLVQNVSFSKDALRLLLYLNVTAGLVSIYFFTRDILNGKYGAHEEGSEFTKRNMIIISCLVLTGGVAIGLQIYFENHRSITIWNTGNTQAIVNVQPTMPIDSTKYAAEINFIKNDFSIQRHGALPSPKVQKVFLMDYNHDGLVDAIAYATGSFPCAKFISQGFGLYKNENGKLRLMNEALSSINTFENVTQSGNSLIVNAVEYASNDPNCCPSLKTTMVLSVVNDKIVGLK